MKVTIELVLEVPGLGSDEGVAARVISGDATRMAIERFRNAGVASVMIRRNQLVLGLSGIDLGEHFNIVAHGLEKELREAVRAAKLPASTTAKETKE